MRPLFLASLIAASSFSAAWAQVVPALPHFSQDISTWIQQPFNNPPPSGPQWEACTINCTEPYIAPTRGYTGDEDNPVGDGDRYEEMNRDTDPVGDSNSAVEGGPAGE
jgi:hypothetical protein